MDNKNQNRGYFYRNERKMQAKQPDFNGKLTIDGKEWQISIWENKDKNGKAYYSISASDKKFAPENKNNPTSNNNNNNSNNQDNQTSPVMGDLDDLFKDEYFS